MIKANILWADDEIDLLRPHIQYLNKVGYEITPVASGREAIESLESNTFDVVFLDENMPGISGLTTLSLIKEKMPALPIVMITKSEEENIMEDAIGKQITDFLIKPIKPQQIQLTLKKILNRQELVKENTATSYRAEFQKMFMQLQENMDLETWKEMYQKLVHWELTLESTDNSEMFEILDTQKKEANQQFFKYVKKQYYNWVKDQQMTMSHNLMTRSVLPNCGKGKPTVLLLIDNLRYDQWKTIESELSGIFKKESEELFTSILPTATQYSRNAIFSGLMPADIKRKFPQYWVDDDEDEGKNKFEEELLSEYMKRYAPDLKFKYQKITGATEEKGLEDKFHDFLNFDLSVLVINFVDMISHARTEMEMIKELASDDSAYRSLTKSWFSHSPLLKGLKKIAEKDVNILITTDHGTKQVKTPSKAQAERSSSTNLRYKNGKNLNVNEKDVFLIEKPLDYGLPQNNSSSKFAFAKEDVYLVYPNNYHHFVQYFKDSYQHGGISLEEMFIPFVKYTNK